MLMFVLILLIKHTLVHNLCSLATHFFLGLDVQISPGSGLSLSQYLWSLAEKKLNGVFWKETKQT